jgi:septal ring factor EnvC (AmiA/AmiB activator)
MAPKPASSGAPLSILPPGAQALADAKASAREANAEKARIAEAAEAEAEAKRAAENQARASKGSTSPIPMTG